MSSETPTLLVTHFEVRADNLDSDAVKRFLEVRESEKVLLDYLQTVDEYYEDDSGEGYRKLDLPPETPEKIAETVKRIEAEDQIKDIFFTAETQSLTFHTTTESIDAWYGVFTVDEEFIPSIRVGNWKGERTMWAEGYRTFLFEARYGEEYRGTVWAFTSKNTSMVGIFGLRGAISNLIVKDPKRRGVAKALIDAVKQFATENGYVKIITPQPLPLMEPVMKQLGFKAARSEPDSPERELLSGVTGMEDYYALEINGVQPLFK